MYHIVLLQTALMEASLYLHVLCSNNLRTQIFICGAAARALIQITQKTRLCANELDDGGQHVSFTTQQQPLTTKCMHVLTNRHLAQTTTTRATTNWVKYVIAVLCGRCTQKYT